MRKISRKLSGKLSFPGGLKFWITIISIAFLIASIFSNLDKLQEVDINRNHFIWLFLGVITTSTSIIINGLAWKTLVNWIGTGGIKINYLRIFIETNVYKYVPGGVWHFVGRVKELNAYMPYKKSLISVLLEPLLMLVSSLILIPLSGINKWLSIICFFSLLVFHPLLINPVYKRLQLFKASQIEDALPNSAISNSSLNIEIRDSGYPLFPLLVEIGFILMRFGGFWCCLNAFSIHGAVSLNQWIGYFALAWGVGLVVPAAPGGLGVFESVFLIRVADSIPAAPLIASLLCYRIISTISDFIILINPYSLAKIVNNVKINSFRR